MPKAMDDDAPIAVTPVQRTQAPVTRTTVNINQTPQNAYYPVQENDFEDQADRAAEVAQEHWFKSFWRPAMGWLYMVICLFDFILFPIAAMILPLVIKEHYVPWDPLTLKSGGLIHLAFGAVLGVTAWGRSREKISGVPIR